MKKIQLLVFGVFCLGIGVGKGQYTVLHNFQYGNSTNGALPTGDLTEVNGKLFGMTWVGGAYTNGCIFSIDTDGNNYRDLWDFNTGTGESPLGTLMLYGNKLYGMAADGGANSSGCIFSIDTNGSKYTDIFDFNGTNGATPQGGSLILSRNILFGMTEFGGVNNDGCIFSVDTNGSGYKKLLDFDYTNNPEGGYPRGSLTLVGSKLFGMTGAGGTNRFDGIIFSIDTNGNNYKDLLNLNGTNGSDPQFGTLIFSNSVLYGMTLIGGLYDSGCVFSIDTSGSNYKDLLDFDGTNGVAPYASLIRSGSKLLGMTAMGSAFYHGNIFSIDTNGNGYKDLFNFNGTNGSNSHGSLTLSGSKAYGMTEEGGKDSAGVIFSLNYVEASVINLTPSSNSIIIFPNPSTGIFTIQAKYEELTGKSVGVYNVMGQKVSSGMLKQVQHDYALDLSAQPNGVYLYRVVGEDGSLAGEGKLIIQK